MMLRCMLAALMARLSVIRLPRGRQTLLTSLLDEVPTHGQVLVGHGEPGIGKVTLAARGRAHGPRARHDSVLTYLILAFSPRPYSPFAGLHQLFLNPCASEQPSSPRSIELRSRRLGLTHEAAPDHFRIAMAALDLLSEIATDAPLLVIVEGAHRLDRPSADVLVFVALRIESDADCRAGRLPRWLRVGIGGSSLARTRAPTPGRRGCGSAARRICAGATYCHTGTRACGKRQEIPSPSWSSHPPRAYRRTSCRCPAALR